MNKIAITASVPDPTYGQDHRSVSTEAAPPAQAAPQELAQPDLRLVIEEDGSSGRFIYKTLDRRTGEIVHQYPREDVLKLGEGDGYKAGRIISATA